MPLRKRSYDDVFSPEAEPSSQTLSRRLKSSSPIPSDSSATSTSLGTDGSTPQPTFSEATHVSATDTEHTLSGDESSDVSESSDEPSSDSDRSERDDDMSDGESEAGDDEIITVVPLDKLSKKPPFRLENDARESATSLRQRARDFLQQMKAANEELEQDRIDGKLSERQIEIADNDQESQYIEMNLGLGVLEQKNEGESNNERGEMEGHDMTGLGETDVLGELLGRSKKEGAGIQEVDT